MVNPHRPFARVLVVVAVFLANAGGRTSPAQDDDEPEPIVAHQPHFTINDGQFDQWVYGGARDVRGGRARLVSLLSFQIDDIDRTCHVSDAQKAKLQLAGRGDIKRFLDRIREKRNEFELVRNDREKFMEFYQGLSTVRQTFQSGVFGEGSLFFKSLDATLDHDQAERYARVVQERQRFKHRATIDLVVASLAQTAGLTADHRQRLRRLVEEETLPPKHIGPYDYQVVLFQVARLPEAKVRPLFDEEQWKAVTAVLGQARGHEPFLITNDLLPDGVARDRRGAGDGDVANPKLPRTMNAR